MVMQVRLSTRWTIYEAWRRDTCYDSTARVTPRRTRDPPGVPGNSMPGRSHRSSSSGRCDVGYGAHRPPRSEGPVGLSFSRIPDNSVDSPNRKANPYSLNSAKSATTIRPATPSPSPRALKRLRFKRLKMPRKSTAYAFPRQTHYSAPPIIVKEIPRSSAA